MHNEKTGTTKFFGFIIVLVPLLMIPTILSGMEADKKPEKNSESHGEYVLKVKGDHISLKAKDASLREILEEIGRKMKIEVVANIPWEDKITIELDMMYLENALKRFKTNYAYVAKTEKEKGKITKIVLVAKGGGKMLPNKFEYNPQPPIQKFEHESQPADVGPEYNPQTPVVRSDNNPQPPDVGSEYNPQPTEVGSEYNPQTPVVGSENNPQPAEVGSEYNPQPPVVESENNPQPDDVESEYNPQPPVVGSEYNPQPSIIEKK
jgi:hypothetical protein